MNSLHIALTLFGDLADKKSTSLSFSDYVPSIILLIAGFLFAYSVIFSKTKKQKICLIVAAAIASVLVLGWPVMISSIEKANNRSKAENGILTLETQDTYPNIKFVKVDNEQPGDDFPILCKSDIRSPVAGDDDRYDIYATSAGACAVVKIAAADSNILNTKNEATLNTIVSSIINWLLNVVVFTSTMFVIVGFVTIWFNRKDKALQKRKSRALLFGIIGFTIGIVLYGIVNFSLS